MWDSILGLRFVIQVLYFRWEFQGLRFSLGIKVWDSFLRFRFGSQVLDSGLGLRFGIQVWYSNFNSCLGFRFGIQVWDSSLD